MKYSNEEIIRYINEKDVKNIRLAFCDIYGNEKNISIMPDELGRAFSSGTSINASAVKNFGEGIFTDLLLWPEAETFSIIPWTADDNRTVRIFCTMTYPDGRPFDLRGTKSLLKRAIDISEVSGYEFYFATELEFYLFKLDENGKPTKEPYDEAGFLDISPEDKCENIRRKICVALEEMGIHPKNSYHDEGPGQNKIILGYTDPLTAGNNIVTLKSVIKNIAAQEGLFADFSPKPLENKPGCGMHINFSVRSDMGSDECMVGAVAGILGRIGEMTAFMNPSEESYRRLTKERAPKYISWSAENHSQLIRLHDKTGRNRSAELRSPDATVNPYLAFALLIFSSLEGLKNNIELMPVSNFDFDTADSETLAKYKKLPSSFSEAAQAAKDSEFIHKHISDDIIDMYLNK